MYDMNSNERLISLIDKYLQGTCTDEETREVEQWYEQMADQQQRFYDGDKEKINQAAAASFTIIRNKLQLDGPDRTLTGKRGVIMSIRRWYAAAAVIMVILVSGLYFFRQYGAHQPDAQKKSAAKLKHTIVPGKNQAVLTLADGSEIVLDETGNGEIAEQAGMKITKTANGQLIYTIAETQGAAASGEPLYNTITTPKGGQYQVILPDGTRVWLNAASSLRYPAMLNSLKSRIVELTGEGYFEVARIEGQFNGRIQNIPFTVKAGDQEVEVLGTHFNINAYTDERATVTTLFEGSVKVVTATSSVLIKPGEHAILRGNTLSSGKADREMAIAWKNGFFAFKKADIKTVMRQLSRWYNVEVEYEGNVPSRAFSGEIYRNGSISHVFDLLDYYKVNYRVEAVAGGKENKIVITH